MEETCQGCSLIILRNAEPGRRQSDGPELSVKGILKQLFGWSRSYCCSFCGKHHSEVAKLIEGADGYICNNCVKICSDVLMKECAEYRESFRDPRSKPEPNTAPSGDPAPPPGNSVATKAPPPLT